MKSILSVISVSAFEQLSNDLKKMVASDLEPFAAMKMVALLPKMQKIGIYEKMKEPRDVCPFDVFHNAETGEFCTADENGRLHESIDLHQVSKKEKGGNCAHVAAYYGRTDVVKFLAKQNFDFEQADKWGRTPVCYAAAKGRTGTVKFLTEQHVDLEKAFDEGRTSFWFAAANGRTETVKFLAEKHVHLKCVDRLGLTPVRVAAEKGHKEIVKFLNEYTI